MHGHLVMGGGRTLYVGRLHALKTHRFAANAILVGLDDTFDVLRDGAVERHAAAFVHGWQWHGLDFHGGRAAVLFLEPGARPDRRVDGRLLRRTVEEALRAHQPALWAELFQNALTLDAVRSKVDERVASAARFLDTAAEAEMTENAVDLAKRLGVSASLIEHRFRDQLGAPMGAYRAWYRMQAATQLALLGRSLTEVAHAAGYFDSAHFSRQFQRMFGCHRLRCSRRASLAPSPKRRGPTCSADVHARRRSRISRASDASGTTESCADLASGSRSQPREVHGVARRVVRAVEAAEKNFAGSGCGQRMEPAMELDDSRELFLRPRPQRHLAIHCTGCCVQTKDGGLQGVPHAGLRTRCTAYGRCE
ncbi:MAG: helix-turn-helix transcriptional regulator [Archangium sp.]